MTRPVSNAFKQAVYAQQVPECFIVLLTISHPSFDDDIRVASDAFELLPIEGVRGVVSRDLEYLYMPFTVNLPSQDDSGIARANISVDNIDRRIVQAVRSANSALGITIEIVRASDVDTPEVTASDFRLEHVGYDKFSVSGDISVEYFDLEPYPAKRFTPSDFPGMF